MLLVIHYWIGDAQDSQGVYASEMTYIVSGVALNSTLNWEIKDWCMQLTVEIYILIDNYNCGLQRMFNVVDKSYINKR